MHACFGGSSSVPQNKIFPCIQLLHLLALRTLLLVHLILEEDVAGMEDKDLAF